MSNSIPDSLAKVLSALLNPLTVATGLFCGSAMLGSPEAPRILSLGLALVFAVGLPAAYVAWLRRVGEIESLFTRSRRARVKALWVLTACCTAGWAALRAVEAPGLPQGLMLCCAANGGLAAVYTWRWRLSLHAAGAWAGQAAAVAMLGPRGLLLAPLAVAASWSRLRLGAHTPGEVVAGAALGAASTWFILTRVTLSGGS